MRGTALVTTCDKGEQRLRDHPIVNTTENTATPHVCQGFELGGRPIALPLARPSGTQRPLDELAQLNAENSAEAVQGLSLERFFLNASGLAFSGVGAP